MKINFMKTEDGEYLAVETIAKIFNVEFRTVKAEAIAGTWARFDVETKRGHKYKMDEVGLKVFQALLVSGNT